MHYFSDPKSGVHHKMKSKFPSISPAYLYNQTFHCPLTHFFHQTGPFAIPEFSLGFTNLLFPICLILFPVHGKLSLKCIICFVSTKDAQILSPLWNCPSSALLPPHPWVLSSSNFCEPLTHVQVFINAAGLKSPGGPRPVLRSLYATSNLQSLLHKVRTSVKNEFLLNLII